MKLFELIFMPFNWAVDSVFMSDLLVFDGVPLWCVFLALFVSGVFMTHFLPLASGLTMSVSDNVRSSGYDSTPFYFDYKTSTWRYF